MTPTNFRKVFEGDAAKPRRSGLTASDATVEYYLRFFPERWPAKITPQSNHFFAIVAELADAHGSGPCTRKGVGVRVPSMAPAFFVSPGSAASRPRDFSRPAAFGSLNVIILPWFAKTSETIANNTRKQTPPIALRASKAIIVRVIQLPRAAILVLRRRVCCREGSQLALDHTPGRAVPARHLSPTLPLVYRQYARP